jgi:hypothetical protein
MGIRVKEKQNNRQNHAGGRPKEVAKPSVTGCAKGKGRFCRNEVLVMEYNVEQ